MAGIADQEHHKFKIFAGALGPGNTLGPVAAEVSRFVAEKKVAAKSIGVEYLEEAKKLIITLGYREGEAHYPIELKAISLGKVENLAQRDDFSALEQAIGDASRKLDKIICHELYITEAHEILLVFMTHS